MTASQLEIPGYVTGTWTLDPVHTDVSFTARHMMVSKVRGRFTAFQGEIVTAADPLDSSLAVSVELKSIDTGNQQRDEHIRSADFFEAEKYPTMTYRSTGIHPDSEDFVVDGELTIKGVTKPVSLRFEVNGFGKDAFGGTRAGFSAVGEINRHDFDVNFNATYEGGGLVVGPKIQIMIEAEAVLNQ